MGELKYRPKGAEQVGESDRLDATRAGCLASLAGELLLMFILRAIVNRDLRSPSLVGEQ